MGCAGQRRRLERRRLARHARWGHTATQLDDGRVLVAGGVGPGGNITASAEIYDPATDSWSAAASLGTERAQHTATLLDNGRVLVAGGGVASAEIYNPATNSWSATGSLAASRFAHTATLLDDGRVLVAGGFVGRRPSQRRDLQPREQQLERRRLACHGTRRPHGDPARRWPGAGRGGPTRASKRRQAPRSTTRRPTAGAPPARSARHATATRRHGSKMAGCSSRGDPGPRAATWPAQRSTTRQPTAGAPPAPSARHVTTTPRPCSTTAGCSSRRDPRAPA